MSTDAPIPPGTNTQRYEAVLRISEALSACRQPEELANTLADQLSEFLPFDSLDGLVLKENSQEIEWHAWGKGVIPAISLMRPTSEYNPISAVGFSRVLPRESMYRFVASLTNCEYSSSRCTASRDTNSRCISLRWVK
jgi:hypothetical protein